MKQLLYLLLLIATPGIAQNNPLTGIMPLLGNDVVYGKVVIADGVSKDELFNRAKRWVALTYKSANDVIQLSDKDAGSLVAKGTILVPFPYNGFVKTDSYLNHTLTIDIKDGKYRYELNDFIVRVIPPRGATYAGKLQFTLLEVADRPMMKKAGIKYCTDANQRIESLIADFEKAMATGKADF